MRSNEREYRERTHSVSRSRSGSAPLTKHEVIQTTTVATRPLFPLALSLPFPFNLTIHRLLRPMTGALQAHPCRRRSWGRGRRRRHNERRSGKEEWRSPFIAARQLIVIGLLLSNGTPMRMNGLDLPSARRCRLLNRTLLRHHTRREELRRDICINDLLLHLRMRADRWSGGRSVRASDTSASAITTLRRVECGGGGGRRCETEDGSGTEDFREFARGLHEPLTLVGCEWALEWGRIEISFGGRGCGSGTTTGRGRGCGTTPGGGRRCGGTTKRGCRGGGGTTETGSRSGGRTTMMGCRCSGRTAEMGCRCSSRTTKMGCRCSGRAPKR